MTHSFNSITLLSLWKRISELAATETRTATRRGSISSDCGRISIFPWNETRIRISASSEISLFSHPGNSSRRKTQSIDGEDVVFAHTRDPFQFSHCSVVEVPRRVVVGYTEIPSTISAFIHQFSRRSSRDCVGFYHLRALPSPHACLSLNYTNTNEPLILFRRCPSYDAIYCDDPKKNVCIKQFRMHERICYEETKPAGRKFSSCEARSWT